MSKLDQYKTSSTDHEEVKRIAGKMSEEGAKSCFFANGAYGPSHFSLNMTAPNTAGICHSRFSTFLALAISAHLPDLFAEAVKFSEADLAEKARAAQAEAIETLQTIKVEKESATFEQKEKAAS